MLSGIAYYLIFTFFAFDHAEQIFTVFFPTFTFL